MKKKEPKIFLHLFQSLEADISHQINDKNFMDKGIYNPFTFVCAASRLESPPLMVKILKVMGAALRFSSCSSDHSCIKMYLLFPKKSQIGLNGKLLPRRAIGTTGPYIRR